MGTGIRRRVVFMGTPDFAAASLRAVLEAGHDVVCVYAQPPRPAGRGQKPRSSPVQVLAEAHDLPVRTPATLRDREAQTAFEDLDADVAVVAAYGLILPKPVLDAPRHGCINVHGSLLPRWRGAAPIQRAIEMGDSETGITIMGMEQGLDTGPMLRVGCVPITDTTTGGALHDTLAELGGRLLVETLEALEADLAGATPQPEDGVTYARKLDRAEARLDWTLPADRLERRLRAFDPWPGAWFLAELGRKGNDRIRVLKARSRPDISGEPGRVVAEPLVVACGAGGLELLEIQRSGRAAMPVAEFLRGHAIPLGSRLPMPDDAGPCDGSS